MAAARAAQPADPLDAQPAGLTPTTARLADILAAHVKAVGALPAGAKDTVAEHWAFTDSGLAGTEDLQRAGTDYHSRIVAGPFVDEFGQYGSTRWHKDPNGFTSSTTEIDERSFYANRVVEDAADPKNDVTVLGETGAPRPAYVLQVKREGYKHPEFVFYDKVSAQVVRIESVAGKRRLVATYDDFRTTDGISRAWHVHDTDGRPQLDDDWRLETLQYGAATPDQAFQMPPNTPKISQATAKMPLPARTIWERFSGGALWGGFLVRVNVNGRGLDFLLDSSSSRSIIDWNVAREMGLPAYGQATRLADGTPVAYRTTIAQASVGGISLSDFAIDSEDFAWAPDQATKVVGVLGYDFFAANVLHFDFTGGTIEALPIADFAQPSPVAGAVDIPFSLNDGLPFVGIGVGNTITRKALLSTTMPFTLILGSFVEAHPDDVRDTSGGKHGQQIVPLADEGTYGKTVEHWSALVSHFRFAIGDYQQVGVVTTNADITLRDQPVDALLGVDYLEFYDLYFAYPYGRILVKPNALFFKTFKKSP